MPNVVLSPHIAAQSESVQRQSVKLLCDSIRLAVNGEQVQSLVNPEIYQGT
jgi:phosphoglycerate dehydrogenase-like enzyme